MKTIKFENRAWKGTRLASLNSIIRDNKRYCFEIGFHFPKKQYYVEVEYTYFRRKYQDTYGKAEYFNESIGNCLKWVENNFKVKTTCINNLIMKGGD